MRRVPLMLIAIGVTAAVAVAAPANLAGPGGRPGAGAGHARIAWHNCGKQVQCARVSVPLNWDQPGGKQIKLAVIRRLATDQRHLIGSMFVNPGGPGESGIDIVRNQAMGHELLAWGGGRFNLVSWDPRRTNESDPVRCFTSQASEAILARRADSGDPGPVTRLRPQSGRPGAVDGWGHPSYALPSSCVDKWRTRYLVNLITPPRGKVCHVQSPFQYGSRNGRAVARHAAGPVRPYGEAG